MVTFGLGAAAAFTVLGVHLCATVAGGDFAAIHRVLPLTPVLIRMGGSLAGAGTNTARVLATPSVTGVLGFANPAITAGNALKLILDGFFPDFLALTNEINRERHGGNKRDDGQSNKNNFGVFWFFLGRINTQGGNFFLNGFFTKWGWRRQRLCRWRVLRRFCRRWRAVYFGSNGVSGRGHNSS